MRHAWMLVLVWVMGCGGAEFALAPAGGEAETGPVGGEFGQQIEAGALEADAPDAATALDAANAPEVHPEASALTDGPPDAAPEASCEPQPVDTGSVCFGIHTTAEVALWAGGWPDSGCSGSGYAVTPAACQCNYTCACFTAHAGETHACADGSGGSCSTLPSGAPVLVCAY